MSGVLPGLPRPDAATATRQVIFEPLVALLKQHEPNEVLRALQTIATDALRQLPQSDRPRPHGAHYDGEKSAPEGYVATPEAIAAAGDELAAALLQQMISDGGPLQHKATLVHAIIVQAVNAAVRASNGMSRQGFVNGMANGVAQMLAITEPEHSYEDFMARMPEVWAHWRGAGQGAGVDMNDTKGSA